MRGSPLPAAANCLLIQPSNLALSRQLCRMRKKPGMLVGGVLPMATERMSFVRMVIEPPQRE